MPDFEVHTSEQWAALQAERGNFEQRRKLAIDRKAREAAEAAELERLRPRRKSTPSVLAVALAVAAISLNPPPRPRKPETFTMDYLR